MEPEIRRLDVLRGTQRTRRFAGFNPARNITVVFTTEEGTAAALRSAADLAARLDARITLAVPDVVPNGRQLNEPTFPIRQLEERSQRVVTDSGVRGTEIRIQIWLCRDLRKCLRQILSMHSIIVLGGRVGWWPSAEQKLRRWLAGLGHHVILADVRAQTCRELLPTAQRQAVLGRTLRASNE
ncbi:MAG: hypothetical protein WA581_06050 [Candidatus Acidiferrales bacterium]